MRPIKILVSLFILLFFVKSYATLYMSVSGRVYDANDSTGIEGITVSVNKEPERKSIGETITNKDGYYILNFLPAHKYSIYVELKDEHCEKYELVDGSKEVTVANGKNITNLNFILKKEMIYPETYDVKLIINAPWGNGIGQFGIDKKPSGAGQSMGPSFYAIDYQGNIYIDDSINYKIQKFNSDGKYIKELKGESYNKIDKFFCFDKRNNMYAEGDFTTKLYRYSSDFVLLNEYKLAPINMQPINIEFDEDSDMCFTDKNELILIGENIFILGKFDTTKNEFYLYDKQAPIPVEEHEYWDYYQIGKDQDGNVYYYDGCGVAYTKLKKYFKGEPLAYLKVDKYNSDYVYPDFNELQKGDILITKGKGHVILFDTSKIKRKMEYNPKIKKQETKYETTFYIYEANSVEPEKVKKNKIIQWSRVTYQNYRWRFIKDNYFPRRRGQKPGCTPIAKGNQLQQYKNTLLTN